MKRRILYKNDILFPRLVRNKCQAVTNKHTILYISNTFENHRPYQEGGVQGNIGQSDGVKEMRGKNERMVKSDSQGK